MKRALGLIFAIAIAIAAIATPSIAQSINPKINGVLSSGTSVVGLYCGGGQSTAVVYIAPGLSSSVVSIYTASGSASNPQPSSNPAWVGPQLGSTYTQQFSSFPAKAYVVLGSDSWVYVTASTYGSGSSMVYIQCSESVAAIGGGSGGTPGPTFTAGNGISFTGSSPVAISVNVSSTCFAFVGGQLTSTCIPSPQITPEPQSSGTIVWSGTYSSAAAYRSDVANPYPSAFAIAFNETGACDGASGPIAELCAIGTSSIGIALGPSNGLWTSGTSVSSQEECFYRWGSGSTLSSACQQLTAAGQFNFDVGGAATTFGFGSSNLTGIAQLTLSTLIDGNLSATPSPICGKATTAEISCNTGGNGPVTVATATTSPASCTANVECLTVAQSFPNTFTATPNGCSASVQDTTTATNIWVAGINTISTTSVTWNIAATTTISAAKGLTIRTTCELY